MQSILINGYQILLKCIILSLHLSSPFYMININQPSMALSLSQKAGGFGMRAPEHYYTASKISALHTLRRTYWKFIYLIATPIAPTDTAAIRDHPLKLRRLQLIKYKTEWYQYLDEQINELNSFIAPRPKHIHDTDKPAQHKTLLRLMMIKSLIYLYLNQPWLIRLVSILYELRELPPSKYPSQSILWCWI